MHAHIHTLVVYIMNIAPRGLAPSDQHTDMMEEMRTEAIEVIVSSVEKFQGKYDPSSHFLTCLHPSFNGKFPFARLVCLLCNRLHQLRVLSLSPPLYIFLDYQLIALR